MNDSDLFGPASACRTLSELIELQKRVVGDGATRAVVAYGMLMGARSAPGGVYHKDAMEVLNFLGAAKAALDRAVNHTKPTVLVTAEILAGAQEFVDEAVVPCTEWPTSNEVVDWVSKDATKYAYSGSWKRLVLGSKGEVVGVEEIHASRGA